MTNLDAIMANISGAHGVVIEKNHFVKALIDLDVSPYQGYTKANRTKINQATLVIYDQILGGANLSEGALNYSINIESVRKAREDLAESMGIHKNVIDKGQVW